MSQIKAYCVKYLTKLLLNLYTLKDFEQRKVLLVNILCFV